uniref:Uncharacterized protein n=1 Tax=Odontella aurita TaxID=265563 RepID=A0A7S4NH63_9STRA|mmetsp:Transcript_63271/g.187063  ORF Transcript_63271/g.187063 Transcript_63271/m.187063 type:complete len:452 (+) Transcript_63271:359-1714(+)|eukprot:CAMPEP_0113543288 /NCGR_PEP_ID=MMETSP0015_2-20120614/10075_1 /TAXON_ID=2838 /ORGANISM="Odontella" /LENGTH=451 /DNA_ID=CAMNT_0000443431 /DNA_START=217 /DNA_END=1572 /DNA_ORIENTATION=- /assembly_acc=CAM_ASM_000160
MAKSRSSPRTPTAAGVLLLAASAAFHPFAVSALDAPSLVSRYGMTASECDTVLMSEISQDFGPPLTAEQSAALWIAASEWRWDVAAASSEDPPRAHPFLVCESTPGTSGWKRRGILDEVTGGLISTDDDDIGSSLYNAVDKTCWTVSAEAHSLEAALLEGGMPDGYDPDSIRVQPLLPGLKMTGGTVDALRNWIERAKVGGTTGPDPSVVVRAKSARASIFSAGAGGDRDEGGVLRLALSVCPAAKQAPLIQLATDLVSFLTENGGEAVTKSSFSYDASMRSDVASSARDEFWSSRMQGSLSDKGATCLSALRNMMVDGSDLDYGTLQVFLPSWRVMGASWEDCLWYATRGMALHPSVCSLEIPGEVTILPNLEDVVVIGGDSSAQGQTGGVESATVATEGGGGEADMSDSKGTSGGSIVKVDDSGTSADFRLPGVRSVTAVLAACWVMLL